MHGLLEKAIPEHEEGSTHALPLFFLSENNKRISTASMAVLGTCPLEDKRKPLKDLNDEKLTYAIRFQDIPFSSFTLKDDRTSNYLSAQDLKISVVDENGALLDAETRKTKDSTHVATYVRSSPLWRFNLQNLCDGLPFLRRGNER